RLEWFAAGTQPGADGAIDPAGLLYNNGWVDQVSAALARESWIPVVEAWMSRARGGPGVKGPYGSKTAYLPGEGAWGGKICGGEPDPSAELCADPGMNGNGNGNGNGSGNGGAPDLGPVPNPTPTPTKPGHGKHP